MMDLACGVMNHGWLGHPPAEIWGFFADFTKKMLVVFGGICYWDILQYINVIM